MKNLFLMFAFVFTTIVTVYSQEVSTGDVKYVIFTSNNKAKETKEGIYKYTAETKLDNKKYPPLMFTFVSESRGIHNYAVNYVYDLEKLAKIRKVNELDRLVIKEKSIEFLDSIDLIDMDILFPKMTKDEFKKIWKSFYNKEVYFIDRSEIKNHKIILYPVKVAGINLY